MKAIQHTEFGAPEVLRLVELPEPRAAANEVVIRSRTIGVNFHDLWARLGFPGMVQLPCIPGIEVAGIIEAVGEAVPGSLQPGQRVIGMPFITHGAYAELVRVPADYVYVLPEMISFEEAATLPLNYLQAYAAMVFMGHIRAGERVLIQAAAGGVGLAAVQLARLWDAEIFATASAEKHDFLKAQGVAHTIDYRSLDFEQEVQRITGNSGVDLIIDGVGGDSLAKDYRLLRYGGRLVCYGASHAIMQKSGLPENIENSFQTGGVNFLDLEGDARAVMGIHLGAEPAVLREWMNEIFHLYSEGKIRPHVGGVFPLAEAAKAHHCIHDRQNIGKVLLIP
jgi:NADPH:quinone reductase-like Zn-dependent oxidoreductase